MSIFGHCLLLFLSTISITYHQFYTQGSPRPLNTFVSPKPYTKAPVFYLNSTYFAIGGLFSMTSYLTGVTLAGGYQKFEAFRYTINQINAMNQLLPGITITYDAFDTRTSMLEALPATIRLLREQNITSIVGPEMTDEAFVAGALTSAYNVTLLSYGTTGSYISKQHYDFFAELVPNDELLINGLASFIEELNWSLIIPLFTNDTYGTSGRNSFLKEASEKNIRFDCFIPVPFGDSVVSLMAARKTIGQIGSCILSSQANVVLLYMDITNAANVISVLYQTANKGLLTFIGGGPWFSFINNPPAFGFYGNFPVSFIQGSIGFSPMPGNTTGFQTYFYSQTPSNNMDVLFTNFWEEMFLCKLNNASLPVCPPFISGKRALPSQCTCDGSENLSQIPIDTQVAYVQDCVYLIAEALHRILYDCTSIQSANLCNVTFITGADIFRVIKEFPIVGSTGLLKFNGIYRENASFTILQTNVAGAAHNVGSYSSEQVLSVNFSQLNTFKGGKVPTSAVIPDVITLLSPIGLFIFLFVCVIMFLAIVCSTCFYIFRNERIIKSASPLFCQLMLLGVLLVSIGLLSWSFNQSTFTCISKVWTSVLGFGLIMGNLLAKTYRIFSIFSNKKASLAAITDMDLLKYSGVVLLFEVVLLSIFTFVDGLPRPMLLFSTTNPFYAYIGCHTENYNFQVAMIILILSFNAILVLLAALLAYLTRNVDSSFNESQYIALTCYILASIMVIGITIYFTNGDGTGSASRQFIERSFITIIGLMTILIVLFGPKLYQLIPVISIYRFNQTKSSNYSRCTTIGSIESEEVASESEDEDIVKEFRDVLTRPRFVTSHLWTTNVKRKIQYTPSDSSASINTSTLVNNANSI